MKRFLKRLLREIFDLAFDQEVCAYATIEDLAHASKLCPATVHRLYQGITKEPRLSTIYKLARAIKMDIELVKEAVLTH